LSKEKNGREVCLMACILVVDDDQFMRKLLREELVKEGHNIQTVEAGSIGIKRMLVENFDVLILDIHMAGITGQETISVVKRIRPHLPIIVITGDESSEMERKIRAQGVFYYFVKPFKMEKMKEVIKAALRKGKPR